MLVFAGSVILIAVMAYMRRVHIKAHRGDFDSPTQATGTEVGQRRFRMEPAWKNLKTQNVHEFLSAQAGTLADKAIFVIGFSQAGVARYLTTDDARGVAYLAFVSISCVLAIVSGFLLTGLL